MKTRRDKSGSEHIRETVKEFRQINTKVGWLESAVYPDGTPVALVAAVQEDGSAANGIPPRGPFRKTVSEQQQNWIETTGNGVKASFSGSASPMQVMEGLGLLAAADVQKTISTLPHDLSEATLYRRKHRKDPPPNQSEAPLRDTMYLFNTLTSVTEKK